MKRKYYRFSCIMLIFILVLSNIKTVLAIEQEQKVRLDFVVPENCVFAIGDNREGSKDCRSFGCIPLEKIESTVVIRFWPFTKFGKVD